MIEMYTILFFISAIFHVSSFNYCSINCTMKHTMCLYPEKSPGKSCGNSHASLMDVIKREEILDAHNYHRNRIAGSYGKFPSASNMLELYWDMELEMIAQRHADQCIFMKSYCSDTQKFQVNQNIVQFAVSEGDKPPEQSELIDALFEEMHDCKLETIRSFKNDTTASPIDLFTQAIWAETDRIGCGEVSFKVGSYIKYFLVCNYGPKGNIPGLKVYKEGKPCSECKRKTRCGINKHYRNLCSDPNAPPVPDRLDGKSITFKKSNAHFTSFYSYTMLVTYFVFILINFNT